MKLSVVSTADRPDLAPLVASWLWSEFWHRDGHSLDDTLRAVEESVTAPLMPRTFIVLADGEPVGTASLAAQDLATRPDLSPWLAGVFVAEHARGRGYVQHLIAAVEAEARAISVPTLWLYTHSAERIYARAGWQTVEMFERNGWPHALMRRELEPGSAA